MDWEKLFLKYIWNDQTTPYLVPLDKLNQRQGNSEILVYSLFLGVFFAVAALISLRGGPDGRSLGVAYYGFSVVCAAVLFTIMKSYTAALYLSATPATICRRSLPRSTWILSSLSVFSTRSAERTCATRNSSSKN